MTQNQKSTKMSIGEMASLEKKRNGEIDLWRFVFAIIILIHHFNEIYDYGICKSGHIAVSFFYIVSGFLMSNNVARIQSANKLSSKNIADATWKYMFNKIKSFYCYYFSVVILNVIVRLVIVRKTGLYGIVAGFFNCLPTFSLTFMGLNYGGMSWYVGNTWFLSAMVIAMFILYPMLLKSYNTCAKLIFPLIAMFVLGYLYSNESIVNWQEWNGICYNAVLRAIAEIALGASLHPLSTYIVKKYSWLINSKKVIIKTLLTIIKIGCYGVILLYACFKKNAESAVLYTSLFCSIGVLLSFSNVGYGIADCRLVRYLGKLSLPIYIYHGFIRLTCKDLIPASKVTVPIFILMIVIAAFLSVILMHFTDLVLKGLKNIILKIKQTA